MKSSAFMLSPFVSNFCPGNVQSCAMVVKALYNFRTMVSGGDGYLRIGRLSRRTGLRPSSCAHGSAGTGSSAPLGRGGFRLLGGRRAAGRAHATAPARGPGGGGSCPARRRRSRRRDCGRGREWAAGARRRRAPARMRWTASTRPPRRRRSTACSAHSRSRPSSAWSALPRRPRRAVVERRRDRRTGALRQQPDPRSVAGDRPRLGLGRGPRAVACAPGEQHDLGLIAFGLTLNRRGWRITYLGPDTPVESLVDTAGGSSRTRRRRRYHQTAARTARRGPDSSRPQTRVAVAGSGSNGRRDGLQTLSEDPVTAALSI